MVWIDGTPVEDGFTNWLEGVTCTGAANVMYTGDIYDYEWRCAERGCIDFFCEFE